MFAVIAHSVNPSAKTAGSDAATRIGINPRRLSDSIRHVPSVTIEFIIPEITVASRARGVDQPLSWHRLILAFLEERRRLDSIKVRAKEYAMKYTMTCTMGHEGEPYTISVEANSKEEAFDKMMADPEMQAHAKAKHPDMEMTPEMKAQLMGMIEEPAA